jgi:nitrogenase molybdenum-iron protein alpha/beta subunit/MoaA/NifB/PqqE/SkfB family radical SAM enzyme
MSRNLASLNVNPCKMCMPMGVVGAFCGIAGCMTILHGSQGCSTYIRRHMATHYNEPVDIASSSLTEEGTVFGGEKNLVKGLDNLIRLYKPKMIGVSTTCLAETIGEDVAGMVKKYRATHPELRAKIVTVSSAGYSGTQYEGHFRALRAIVEQTDMNRDDNGKITVVTGLLSPADTRWLKGVLHASGLDCILFPDNSENLDGENGREYNRLPAGGTRLEDITSMAGARLTMELAHFVPDGCSPGEYLRDVCGVPLVRLLPPMGLRDTDAFHKALRKAGAAAAAGVAASRGRRLDGMVDSHKYNARVRAAVFGESDFVLSVCRMMAENGSLPLVAATGSKTEGFAETIRREVDATLDFHLENDVVILDDCDFETIEMEAKRLGVNVLVGSSDARRVSERTGIPLVRCAFPIHDHVGGQRVRTLGHEGGLALMDRITNAVLGSIEHGFRKELYDKYYRQGRPDNGGASIRAAILADNRRKSGSHPCFNGCGGAHGRIHLPVAPACNIQCNYCVRKFDCPNESRPGVSTAILSPEQALKRFVRARAGIDNLDVVGIAGPGDALANWAETRETLRLIRKEHPEVTFCISTNGLELPSHVRELADLGVSHLTVTVNAVDPSVGAKVYKHVDYMGTRHTGESGAALILANQMAGIRWAVELGMICKMNIVMLKGVNECHIPKVAATAAELGCELSNIMQMVPVAGSAFENTQLVSNVEIGSMRERCGLHLRQMTHCRQCRADAVGRLEEDLSAMLSPPRKTPGPGCADKVLRLAVASRGGVLVDQHLGQATEFYVYEYDNGEARFCERRGVPGAGASTCDGKGGGKAGGKGKLDSILQTIADCDCVLAMRMGASPKETLGAKGVIVHEAYGTIEEGVNETVAKYLATMQIPVLNGKDS